MRDGWNEGRFAAEEGDCRKLVTLEKHRMIWVGIRAYAGAGQWHNNGEIEKAEILAWRDLPAPAYSDGLMAMMSSPTLPAGDG